MESTPHEKPISGTLFLNRLIVIINNASYNIVLAARHLNSNTDLFFEFWPRKILAAQLVKANKECKSAFDFMYA